MPSIHVTKDNEGRICGVSEKDNKAYGKFIRRLQELTNQTSMKLTWSEPRSGPFHRRHFAMLNVVFENQEAFDDEDHMRKWLEVGAGYADLVPGPDGKPVAMPKSISYDSLDQAEFEPIHKAVFAFLRTEYACGYLWPGVSYDVAYGTVDAMLREFE